MASPIPVQIFQSNGVLAITHTRIRTTGTINTITVRNIGITEIMVTDTTDIGIMDIDITGNDTRHASLRGFFRDPKLTVGQNAEEFVRVSLPLMAGVAASLDDSRFRGRFKKSDSGSEVAQT